MSRILYVGDLHGKTNVLGSITMSTDRKEDASIIQVGDFGFGFPDRGWLKWLEKRARRTAKDKFTTPIYTCMGNHDNWELLYEMWEEQGKPALVELFPGSKVYYVHRSSIVDIEGISHLFLGGAESTDKHLRVEGRDWWAKEQPDSSEFNKFFELFNTERPNTIVTHDAPIRVHIYRTRRKKSITPNSLEHIYRKSDHKPRRHYFGHHHMFKKWKVEGTKFYCCGLHGEYFERISNV